MPAANGSMEEKARAVAERVAVSEGLELVGVEWLGSGRHSVLRIYVDKPDGITHADCVGVSRQVSTIFDIEETIPGGAYQLEVSSPGLDRKLFTTSDYERFKGKKATIRFKRPVDGRGQVTGCLAGVAEDGRIALELEAGERLSFEIDEVRQARLVIEI